MTIRSNNTINDNLTAPDAKLQCLCRYTLRLHI